MGVVQLWHGQMVMQQRAVPVTQTEGGLIPLLSQ